MEYFRISQDKRYLHTPTITNMGAIAQRRKAISLEYASKIPDVNVLFADSPQRLDFIDILDKQLFLVSEPVKQVFSVYEPGMLFKNAFLINNCLDEYARYFIPFFSEIDCIGEQSDITPDKTYIRHLSIIQPPPNLSIFKVAGLMTDAVIIRLDVAESLLRRNIKSYKLCRVAVEKKAGILHEKTKQYI